MFNPPFFRDWAGSIPGACARFPASMLRDADGPFSQIGTGFEMVGKGCFLKRQREKELIAKRYSSTIIYTSWRHYQGAGAGSYKPVDSARLHGYVLSKARPPGACFFARGGKPRQSSLAWRHS
jgi:hypothetical protein